MPVYEYRCDACNIQFELRQKFSDPPADKCPKCGRAVRKMVSAASFSLKGGGWYGDGYSDKAAPDKLEGETTAGTGDGVADAGTATEGASTEATASPATLAPASSQVETKSSNVALPTPTKKDKAEVKTSTSDAVS